MTDVTRLRFARVDAEQRAQVVNDTVMSRYIRLAGEDADWYESPRPEAVSMIDRHTILLASCKTAEELEDAPAGSSAVFSVADHVLRIDVQDTDRFQVKIFNIEGGVKGAFAFKMNPAAERHEPTLSELTWE